MYPNPLVADLIAADIVNRIVSLSERGVEPDRRVGDALARLARELDLLAMELDASLAFLRTGALR